MVMMLTEVQCAPPLGGVVPLGKTNARDVYDHDICEGWIRGVELRRGLVAVFSPRPQQ
jgi:hypothetical protein